MPAQFSANPYRVFSPVQRQSVAVCKGVLYIEYASAVAGRAESEAISHVAVAANIDLAQVGRL
jgi:hypothetical protein